MYNPTISKREIIKAHELGIAVFAWTVNSLKDFEQLKRYGIDGIITDYPGAFIKRESTTGHVKKINARYKGNPRATNNCYPI